jgi:serine protease Do
MGGDARPLRVRCPNDEQEFAPVPDLTPTIRIALRSSSLLALVLGFGLSVAPIDQAQAFGAPDSFADLAEGISPSVVNITTSALIAAPADGAPMVPEGSPFEDFFDDFNTPGDQGPQRSEALGSGFVVSEDGYIVTNNHVIEGADEIMIEFFSGKKLPAKLVGTDPKTDIALLKVEADAPLPFVTFGNSDLMRVGDWVMAMGNPLGQGFSVSAGIVSARGRELSGSYDDFIQTDAAINRGNSGGPLFNMDGQVIGVNTSILSPTGGSIGIGFSMSSNVVSKVVDQLREFGETRRGWLGVRIQDVTPDVAEAMALPEASGALVTDVPDGPAKDAGLVAGDVITRFDGQPVSDAGDLTRRVADAPIGQAVPASHPGPPRRGRGCDARLGPRARSPAPDGDAGSDACAPGRRHAWQAGAGCSDRRAYGLEGRPRGRGFYQRPSRRRPDHRGRPAARGAPARP